MEYKSSCVYCGEDYSYEESWWRHHITRMFDPFYSSLDFQCQKCKEAIISLNEKKDELSWKEWKRQRNRILNEDKKSETEKKE